MERAAEKYRGEHRKEKAGSIPAAGHAELKIGEVSKRSGVGVEALRFYEKSGLLDPPGRTQSGYRVYGGDVLDRIDFIKKAQVLGFSLEEIRELIDHKRHGQNPCVHVRAKVRSRLDELTKEIEQMMRYRDELGEALEEWERAGESEGHVCGLIEGSHVEGINGHDFKKGKQQ